MLHHANRASLITTRDPNFDYVTLLLHGDGTNGGQNNTFIDGSTNNFTITRNGNATQGTFSPYGTLWSNYFDGTVDFLSIADNVALRPESSIFTIEAWVYRNASGAAHTIYAKGNSIGPTGFVFQIASTNVLRFTDTTTNIDSTATIAASVWTHVAVVREGTGTNQVKLYINGVQDGQGTVSTNFNQTNQVRIGRDRGTTGEFAGYISNVRFVKGTAVYTANFTPPTQPLTAVANTSLLTCQSNRFIDNSSNAFTITRNGDVSVQRFSPFNPPGEYSTSIIGGSGYFDGTGDYLSVADSANLRFGTSAFTVQAWIYRSASGAAHSIIAKGGASTGWVLQVTSGNVLRFTHGTTNVDTTTTIPALGWTHVAAVRTSTGTNGFQLYINGVSAATATVSTDFNQTDTLYIGADRSVANVMNGYISGIKYTNGTAESISVPTSPPVATTNVALLCVFTNASIIDNAMMQVSETVGNAQISTSVSKFGTGSLSFDGTGDWLLVPHSPDQFFGTSVFTVELWLYLSATGSACGLVGKGTATTGWLVSTNASNNVVFTFGTSTITSTGTISGTTWAHVAVVREGTGTNQTKIYINGTNDGTGTVSTNFNQTNAIYVGADRTGGSALNGNIDDLRITRGIARYTANFTPRNTPFPNM